MSDELTQRAADEMKRHREADEITIPFTPHQPQNTLDVPVGGIFHGVYQSPSGQWYGRIDHPIAPGTRITNFVSMSGTDPISISMVPREQTGV